MGEVVREGIAGSRRSEIAAEFAPIHNCVHYAANQLAHRVFTLRRVRLSVEVLRRNDIRCGLRPGFRYLHVFLAEDHLPLFIADLGDAPFPFDSIERRNTPIGKKALKVQADFWTRLWCGRGHYRIVVLERHLGFRHLASAQVGVPAGWEPLYFTKQTSDPPGRCFRFSGGNRSIRTTSDQARDAQKS